MTSIPIRTLLAVCVLALTLGFVAACGGDDSDDDPQAILEETFDGFGEISSGTLSMDVSASAGGKDGGSFEATAEGPFQGDPDDPAAIPQLDIDVSASGKGGGESLDFEQGVTITEDNAYFDVRGRTYELGTERFAAFTEALAPPDGADSAEESSLSLSEACAQAVEEFGGDPSICDIDVASWLTNLTDEGTEEVGGAEATHISGDADVQQVLTDVGELIGGFAGPLLEGFDPSALGTFSDLVTVASIDIYSGTEDRLLRGLDAELVIDPSALGIPVGIGTIEGSLSLEIADLNEEQTIEAPAKARPFEDIPGGGFDLGDLDLGLLPEGDEGGDGAAAAEECLEEAQGLRELEKCLP